VTKLLLSLHVLAAIVAIGPVTVAASMFPAALRRGRVDQLPLLHRICRVYAGVGIAVPVFGLATASALGVLGDAWVIASMVLTAIAAAVLVFLVLPGQEAVLSTVDGAPNSADVGAGGGGTAVAGAVATRVATRLGMQTGVFNLLWATVTVLMIIRPGSTTGV